MKAKKLTLGLALALALSALPLPTLAAGESGVKVNGVDILTAPENTVSCGDGTAVYDPQQKTLTLTDITIDQLDASPGTSIKGIEVHEPGVTILLVGDNTVENVDIGILGGPALTIRGVDGGKLCIRSNRNRGVYGVQLTGGGLTLADAVLDLQVADRPNNTDTALCVRGDSVITNSTLVIAMEDNQTLYPNFGIDTGENTLTISQNSSVRMDKVSGGITAGNLSVQDSALQIAVDAAQEQTTIGVSGEVSFHGAQVSVTMADGPGNIVYGDTIEIDGNSQLDLSGNGWPALFANSSISIADSTVQAQCAEDIPIFTRGSLTMENAAVTAEGPTEDYSIYAVGALTITGGSTELGDTGLLRSENVATIGGLVTAGGTPAYDRIDADVEAVFAAADYTAVDAALARTNALNRTHYRDLAALDAAISAVVRGQNITQQAAVDGYAADIESALAALRYRDADYSRVDRAIVQARALNPADYRDFSVVEAALAAVVQSQDITQQAAVDGYAADIESALAALRYRDADYSRVDRAIVQARALNPADYRDFSAVEAALAAVVRNQDITHQAAVDEMARAIEIALTQLEKVPTSPGPPSTAEDAEDSAPPSPTTADNRPLFWLGTLVLGGVILAATLYRRRPQSER